MIALIILGSIAALICLILFLPVGVGICYDKSFSLKIYYAGIKVFDTKKVTKKEGKKPKKEKKTKEKEKSEEQKKENFFVKDFHNMGKVEFIKYYAAVLGDVIEKLIRLVKKIRVKIFDFTLAVASGDAHTTAIQYGAVSAAVGPVLNLIFSLAKIKAKHVDIYADFVGQSMFFKTDIKFSLKPIYICFFAVRLYKIYKALKSGTYKVNDNKTPDTADNTNKG